MTFSRERKYLFFYEKKKVDHRIIRFTRNVIQKFIQVNSVWSVTIKMHSKMKKVIKISASTRSKKDRSRIKEHHRIKSVKIFYCQNIIAKKFHFSQFQSHQRPIRNQLNILRKIVMFRKNNYRNHLKQLTTV